MSVRQEKLDQLSVDALADRVLTPEKTIKIVDAVIERREANHSDANQTLNQLRGQLGRTNSRIRNLLDVMTDGVAGDSALFRESPSKEETERENLLQLIEIEASQESDRLKPIDATQAAAVSEKLKRLIREAPVGLRKRYLGAIVSEIRVGKSEIVISGPDNAIADATTGRIPDIPVFTGKSKSYQFCTKWLPFVNAYRTLCQAPKSEFRVILQEVSTIFSPACVRPI